MTLHLNVWKNRLVEQIFLCSRLCSMRNFKAQLFCCQHIPPWHVCLCGWLVTSSHKHTHIDKNTSLRGLITLPLGRALEVRMCVLLSNSVLLGCVSLIWRLMPGGSGCIVCTNRTDPSDERPKMGRTQWDALTNFMTLAEASISCLLSAFTSSKKKSKWLKK